MINLFGFKVCNAIAIVAATTFALGISPPGAPKTVPEAFDSHGSRCSTVGTRPSASPRPRAPPARWRQLARGLG